MLQISNCGELKIYNLQAIESTILRKEVQEYRLQQIRTLSKLYSKGEGIMKSIKTFFIVMAAICVLAFASHVFAQETPFTIENVPNVVGVGVGMIPDYEGSNNYEVGAAPFFKLTYPKTQWYALLVATELYVNVLNHPFLRFGPVVNYHFGRNDTFDVDDKVVKKMSEIDDTWEAGAFAGVEFIDSNNPRNRFSSSVTFLSDVGDAYNGYTINMSARFWHEMHKMVDVRLGAGINYSDDNYMDTYFGISESDSEKTGLNVFKA
jgi:outer membrane protein